MSLTIHRSRRLMRLTTCSSVVKPSGSNPRLRRHTSSARASSIRSEVVSVALLQTFLSALQRSIRQQETHRSAPNLGAMLPPWPLAEEASQNYQGVYWHPLRAEFDGILFRAMTTLSLRREHTPSSSALPLNACKQMYCWLPYPEEFLRSAR